MLECQEVGVGAMVDIAPLRRRRNSNDAVQVRNVLLNYFISDARSLPWYWEYVRSRGPLNY